MSVGPARGPRCQVDERVSGGRGHVRSSGVRAPLRDVARFGLGAMPFTYEPAS